MPGTRTAPTVNGTPSFVRISIQMIDYEGDLRSVSYIADAAVTDIQIEALVNTTALATNASVYAVTKSEVYEGARQKGNATEAVVNSVFSNVVYHVKASPTSSQRGYIPAPIEAIFVDGTDDPDPNNLTLTNWFTAVLDAVGGAYSGQSLRYTERREQNDAIKL